MKYLMQKSEQLGNMESRVKYVLDKPRLDELDEQGISTKGTDFQEPQDNTHLQRNPVQGLENVQPEHTIKVEPEYEDPEHAEGMTYAEHGERDSNGNSGGENSSQELSPMQPDITMTNDDDGVIGIRIASVEGKSSQYTADPEIRPELAVSEDSADTQVDMVQVKSEPSDPDYDPHSMDSNYTGSDSMENQCVLGGADVTPVQMMGTHNQEVPSHLVNKPGDGSNPNVNVFFHRLLEKVSPDGHRTNDVVQSQGDLGNGNEPGLHGSEDVGATFAHSQSRQYVFTDQPFGSSFNIKKEIEMDDSGDTSETATSYSSCSQNLSHSQDNSSSQHGFFTNTPAPPEAWSLEKHLKKPKKKIDDAEDRIHACPTCDKRFTCEYAVVRHLRTHSTERPFKCDKCDKAFVQISGLTKHKKTHLGIKPHECPICKKCFAQYFNLDAHMRIHTGDKPHECPLCKKCFTHSSNLNTHLKTHTGEKPHKCPTCDKCFSHASNLNAHIRIHTGVRPHDCTMCEKKFSKASDLRRHLRIHNGEKPHQCPICDYCSCEAGDLRKHMRIHTGEKPYKCQDCGKCFTNQSGLANHKKSHTGERPHQCPTCKKCYQEARDLKSHIRTHTGERANECMTCQKCFSSPANLRAHMKIHSGIKPHECPKCPLRFSRTSNVRRHIKRHHGDEKMFECGTCEETFYLFVDLNVHIKTHNPNFVLTNSLGRTYTAGQAAEAGEEEDYDDDDDLDEEEDEEDRKLVNVGSLDEGKVDCEVKLEPPEVD